MGPAFFPSSRDHESIDVQFIARNGRIVSRRMLVDTGFTGLCDVVLPPDATVLAHDAGRPVLALGALSGMQRRLRTICLIPALPFQASVIAMIGDLSPLALPAGVDGMIGLRFLRRFDRWGAERDNDARWSFFLSLG